MTEAPKLQAFLYQAMTANVRVAGMVEDGQLAEPPAPGSPGGRTVLDEFSIEARTKAMRMGRTYELLFCLENSMRELIERTLKEVEDLNEWTDGIKPDILANARNREEQDEAARWHGPRGESILSYLDFPDLGAITLHRWDDFADLLGGSPLGRGLLPGDESDPARACPHRRVDGVRCSADGDARSRVAQGRRLTLAQLRLVGLRPAIQQLLRGPFSPSRRLLTAGTQRRRSGGHQQHHPAAHGRTPSEEQEEAHASHGAYAV